MNLNADEVKAKSIFLNAVELCGRDDWASYLDQECGGNAELRRPMRRKRQLKSEKISFLAIFH